MSYVKVQQRPLFLPSRPLLPTTPPRDPGCASAGGGFGAALWSFGDGAPELTKVCALEGNEGVVRSILWHPEDEESLVSIEEGAVRFWSVGDCAARVTQSQPADDLQTLWSGAWSPAGDLLVTCGGNNLQLWDTRNPTKVKEIENAHRMPVRDIDFGRQNTHQVRLSY